MVKTVGFIDGIRKQGFRRRYGMHNVELYWKLEHTSYIAGRVLPGSRSGNDYTNVLAEGSKWSRNVGGEGAIALRLLTHFPGDIMGGLIGVVKEVACSSWVLLYIDTLKSVCEIRTYVENTHHCPPGLRHGCILYRLGKDIVSISTVFLIRYNMGMRGL